MLRCSRCGRPAIYFDHMAGRSLCVTCLSRSLEQRFRRSLREAKPRRNDVLVLVGRGDLASLHALKLLLKVEEGYPTTVKVLEVSSKPICKDLCEERGVAYSFHEVTANSYTRLRLQVLRLVEEYGLQQALLVMPDTVEDLALYAMGEVWLGDLRGLILDLKLRTAYPQSKISLKAIAAIMLSRGSAPRAILQLPQTSKAKYLISDMEKNTPSLLFSASEALLKLLREMREKHIKAR